MTRAEALRELQLRAMRRPEWEYLANPRWQGAVVLVAGAAGQIGRAVVEQLRAYGAIVFATDRCPDPEMAWLDVRSSCAVTAVAAELCPDLVVNLAAAKLAPAGELDPWETISTSVVGVHNLSATRVPLLQVSTCKAADPEVAYGAGKLAAEKLAMAAGGNVVRLFNIPEAGPSMLTYWFDLVHADPDAALPVTPCRRFTATLREAVSAVCAAAWFTAAGMKEKRWAIDPGNSVEMADYAGLAFPGQPILQIPPRRGDRIIEPLHAACERAEHGDAGLFEIRSRHDG